MADDVYAKKVFRLRRRASDSRKDRGVRFPLVLDGSRKSTRMARNHVAQVCAPKPLCVDFLRSYETTTMRKVSK